MARLPPAARDVGGAGRGRRRRLAHLCERAGGRALVGLRAGLAYRGHARRAHALLREGRADASPVTRAGTTGAPALRAGARRGGSRRPAERFRPLPLAITFDESWHYGLESPHDLRHSRPWTNEHGRQQGTCVHCGNCYLGCQASARNTLDLNYLARAENLGAEIRPLHIARAIAPDGQGYRVHFDRIHERRLVPGTVRADRVVVAAGSLGSTELLLRCRDEHRSLPGLSAALGTRWSANGDFLTVSIQPDRVDPTYGPTITGAVDFLDGSVGNRRFFVQDGGSPITCAP